MTISDIPVPSQNPEVLEFDYILCGGGTSGLVVASRLAEDPDVSVLVIEAGQDNELLEYTKFPGGWKTGFGTEADWNLLTTPSKGIDNRQVAVSRGRFLGGCSGCNGTLAIRGVKADYDEWKLPGWSGEEVWAAMNKAETFHPNDGFTHDENSHGTSGPLHTAPTDPAPITGLLLESMADLGMPAVDDLFSRGDTAHGSGLAVRTVHGGIRRTAADFLKGADENLKVWTQTTVDKINLTPEDGEMRATSVDVLDKSGNTRTIKARKEIIVSSGAYCSPAILLRSGIGEKKEVENFGIESKVDLPGVGKNLMDHVIAFIFYEVSKPGLTTDHKIYVPDGPATAIKIWHETKSGFLSQFPFGAFAYARLDERLADSPLWSDAPKEEGYDPMGLTPKQPNIEIFSTECYGGPSQCADLPLGGQSTFSVIPELFSPRSKGTVTLKSKDPLENPVIDHKYLEDPLDMLVMSEACAYANEVVMKGKGTRDIVQGSWPSELNHHAYKTREDWVPFLKKHATTCYHAGGTCKMGKKDDPLAVLDERLRIRGVKGLRVADTSVMPSLNSGHTQMPAYAIGERCAEIIKEDNGMGVGITVM